MSPVGEISTLCNAAN